ncbi:hypothetical protein NK718_13205 [Alsobacter sp. SYSU M60028]|uniref:Uncharacterized protein n=1 Tax=Alsobacter ponti TaxID=2962936 RepID=A0ABT1LD98_9HYPH|nr:hypothetical protein [Alsobacter ponti]MCP8939477.1 hypothetical protein [Alsobacter ponti]
MRSTIMLAAVLAVAPSARAQDANGRFVMSPTPDGYLKMDTRTGAVSQCTRQGGDYQCRLTPDERTALQDEIDRLSRENAELRSRVAGGPAPALPTPAPGEAKPSGPSDADIDRALTVMERFLRRFKDILRDEPTQNRL